ncbi:MAG: hypothetical protein M5R40_19685 [Anaerolineae bacterium]|nr:hypothetical protein [Anaerolineae bacterium]
MRDRILAVVQGREHDRVPFVIYDGMLPMDQVRARLGSDRIGLLRWSRIHQVRTPHCRFETEAYYVGETKWHRVTLHTPAGAIYEERAFETGYNSSAIRKHYVEKPEDYEVLWAYLEDSIIAEDFDCYYRDEAELGDSGLPLVAVERTPYQQLWIQWVGLEQLSFHWIDYPDRVEKTIDMLRQRVRKVFEIAYRSPAPVHRHP